MRPIKFRAWDTYKMKMFAVKGMRVIEETGAWEIWDGELLIAPFLLHLMQFTGLSDKNGKEIYEGDIVQWIDSDGQIRFDQIQFAFAKFFLCNNLHSLYEYLTCDLIVTGNIYENPELLEKECVPSFSQ